jgi:anaerobic selenocysteine-containing dehydrogenase
MSRVVHTVCPHDCPDACSVLVTIEDGRATRIEGNPDHPVTRGFLCGKVAKYLERVYSPDRLLYPMRRIAANGTSGAAAFEWIGWDEALEEVGSRLAGVAREFGPESILPYSYGGTIGQIHGNGMDRRFFHRLGASQLDRTICAEAGGVALVSVTGAKWGPAMEDFRHARYIIAWGANILGTNIHLWPFIEEARRNGARLVAIDPFRTRTAAAADWHLAIRPGTDVALALGLMHSIIANDLHDARFVAEKTSGFAELRKRVAEYTPQRVAEITGLGAEEIERLAREYATCSPAMIRLNYGVQRSENGGMAVRAITMLPTITGAWQRQGGGLTLSTSQSFKLNKTKLQREDLMTATLGRPARTLNMNLLGRLLRDRELTPAGEGAVRVRLEPRGGGAESQPGGGRTEAQRSVHGGPRAVSHRHHGLRGHCVADDDLSGTKGTGHQLRTSLSATFRAGDRGAGRGVQQRGAVPAAGGADGDGRSVFAGLRR